MQLGETFSLRQSLAGANEGVKGLILADEYTRRTQKNKTVGELAGKVSQGDEQAARQLIGVDPEIGVKVINAMNSLDQNKREMMKQGNDAMAKAVTWVMQGPAEERAQRWDQSIDHLVNNQGIAKLADLKGQFSEQNAQLLLTQAMSMDQLINDSEFGEVKAGVRDGKPVYFVTNKQGEAKVVEGIQPDGKSGKDSRTALEKNVPFLVKTMKISEKEAAKLLTASKDKSPQGVYTEIYSRALTSTYGDDQEAERIAGTVMRKLYGRNWQQDLPNAEEEVTNPNDPNSIRSYLAK